MRTSFSTAVAGIAPHHQRIFKSLLNPFFAFIFLIGTVPAVSGADFWEKKEYGEWSQRQATKILEDSPWAKIYKPITYGSDTGSDGMPQFVQYNIRFSSALPIRQATVRLSQIANNYDKLSSDQKQAFDSQAEPFLAVDFTDFIVIDITYSTNIITRDQTLATHWQTQTTETLKNIAYLIGTNGVKVPLLEYKSAQGAGRAFQLIFPRKFGGQPILNSEDKTLTLEFELPGASGTDEAHLEFKVKKMIVGDKLQY